jgi:hypothetical protein
MFSPKKLGCFAPHWGASFSGSWMFTSFTNHVYVESLTSRKHGDITPVKALKRVKRGVDPMCQTFNPKRMGWWSQATWTKVDLKARSLPILPVDAVSSTRCRDVES